MSSATKCGIVAAQAAQVGLDAVVQRDVQP